MRECFIPMISKSCGIIAADVIKRVVMYGVGDDFLCNRIKDENMEILEKHWISPARSYALQGYQPTRLFLSDFTVAAELTKPMQISPTDVYSSILHERRTSSKAPSTTGMPHFTSSLNDEMEVSTINFKYLTGQTELYYTEMPPFEMDTEQFFDEYSTPIPAIVTSSDAYLEHTLFPSEETYSFTNFTSFGLYEILDNGDASYLGCGTSTVQWATDLKLKNLFCGWVNGGAANNIFKCTIHLGEACIFEDPNKKEINMDSKILLVVFNLENGSYQEVATMKMRNFKPEENAFTLVADMVDDKHSEIGDQKVPS
ncbi:hypothetical protein TNIN_279701 [Trichonephila inaurata madagascariensis]|uniref:Uncharacterized protein n=1 Tax=Trichonephila inaurata madagascariensis TaxID=2747483 RepID=A0A8X6XFJ6_9ARAC|nr:hypothetical protein TNIN_279701 [Trichonephila inaurata madagascariensis]